MNKEFHYYATGLITQRAGFSEEDAETIARASQFVDENDVALEVRERGGSQKPYRNFISQTMNILKPKKALMRIYPVFHFVPGDSGTRLSWRNLPTETGLTRPLTPRWKDYKTPTTGCGPG